MAKDLFNRYIWLVDTIYRTGKITFEEINDRWLRNEMSEGKELPLRTFHNHRIAIEELFDINIECDKRNGYVYSIENEEDMEKGGVRSWLLNTFAVNNLINESHKLKHRILFEHIPSGQQYLTTIIEAMRDGLSLWVSHQSFGRDEAYEFEIEPYALKVSKQRWYVLANSVAENRLRIYALDRMQKAGLTENRFEPPAGFDAEAYFTDCFGIIAMDGRKTETVRLKVNAQQANYLRSLPLHHSQTEERGEEYSIFTVRLKPSYDFRQEVLKYGGDVEVIEPKWFREEVAEVVRGMGKIY
jgi:hypothetical protein